MIDDNVFGTFYGSLILFGTQSGRLASDGVTNKNGVFTQYLLAALKDPHMELYDFFQVYLK